MLRWLCSIYVLSTALLFAIPATGEIRIAAILIKFQNDAENTAFFDDQKLTPELCSSFLFEETTSVAAFFEENSYGKLAVSGDVFGPYVIPVNAPSETNQKPCMNVAETIAASDADINFSQFDLILIIYPRPRDEHGNCINYCDFQGANQIQSFLCNEGEFTRPIIWINGILDLHIIAHEMGHAVGLLHANKRICQECYNYQIGCSIENAHDPFDVMGYNTAPGYKAPGHFNAYSKWSLGWLDSSQIKHIDRPGVYDVTLTPLETDASGYKMVSIPMSSGKNYIVEYRKNIGFDQWLSPLNGLLFRFADTKPLKSTALVLPVCGSTDMVLREGQEFSDVPAFIRVKALAERQHEMVVRVTYDTPNVGAKMSVTDWPSEMSLGDSIVVPFTLYNECQFDITEPIYLVAIMKTPRGKTRDLIELTHFLPRNDSLHSSFTFRPQDGCGKYAIKLALSLPKDYSEIYLSDNFLTDKDKGQVVTVLCDGPDLQISLSTTPMVFDPGEPVSLAYEIANLGERASGPFSVLLETEKQAFEYEFLSIEPGGSAGHSIRQTFACGIFDVRVSVDAEDVLAENDETNNQVTKLVWSNERCDGQLDRPLFAASYRFRFKVAGQHLVMHSYDTAFFSYSPETCALQNFLPLQSGRILFSYDAFYPYCAMTEWLGQDSWSINIFDMRSGEGFVLPTEHPYLGEPTMNENWTAWLEKEAQNASNSLMFYNLITGEKQTVDTGVIEAELTTTNLLYYITRHTVNDNQRLMVYDIKRAETPVELPIEGVFMSTKYKGNELVSMCWNRGECSIQWRRYDPEEKVLSKVLHEFSDESLGNGVDLLDFNEEYLLYRKFSTHSIYLYSKSHQTARELSSLIPGLATEDYLSTDVYFRDNEILALCQKENDIYYVGSVSIDDINNIPVHVESGKSESSVLKLSASPNPFNQQTTITYSLSHVADVELQLFNTLGQRVRTIREQQSPGKHTIVWDGTDEARTPVASGVYVCTIKVADQVVQYSLKLLLLK